MATPITKGTAFDFGAAAQETAQLHAATPPAVSVQQATNREPGQDTIELSDSAQVRLLNAQGQTVSEIVVDTALSTQAVNSYLGISQTPLPTVAATAK